MHLDIGCQVEVSDTPATVYRKLGVVDKEPREKVGIEMGTAAWEVPGVVHRHFGQRGQGNSPV